MEYRTKLLNDDGFHKWVNTAVWYAYGLLLVWRHNHSAVGVVGLYEMKRGLE